MNNVRSKLCLFLGGSQSGKSLFAENCAKNWQKVVYYATGGQIENSPEWELRINKHRQRRPDHWTTIEYPVSIDSVVNYCQEHNAEVLIIDCLSLWMGWLIAQNAQLYSHFQLLKHLETEFNYFIKKLTTLQFPVLVVSNEVGQGVTPSTESGRVFREALGHLNQALGNEALCVSFSIAGQNILLKDSSQNFLNGFCPLGIINENYIISKLNSHAGDQSEI
ncbi:bifunctional adenosylcobinamide kinase/adenosylcobinamide-phosphate guanylyltransferase [Spirobacillus cienkowskii]|jgi:adenosylcobinamide kinase/adenosylcobinamide-phosphate guanylyltransferase|uniref:Adenosylcobinamide kinase n=1 Tax=Spirobacillus cienkowskii TaxID=495820 RepID=A0A369KKY6_9BACT|nr:MAG: bifunctional adenosylcobinamide kinase/adenosylcobinamide-phosphate guanylyltransferase [Spirobacillus cienkowskii]